MEQSIIDVHTGLGPEILLARNVTLDYEVTPHYNVTITAVDDGSPRQSSTTTMIINIQDIDEPPYFTNLPTTIHLAENTTINTTIFTITATDNENENLTFILQSLSPSPDAFNVFTNGNISLDNSTIQLDRLIF